MPSFVVLFAQQHKYHNGGHFVYCQGLLKSTLPKPFPWQVEEMAEDDPVDTGMTDNQQIAR
jgi:hypothetical protein